MENMTHRKYLLERPLLSSFSGVTREVVDGDVKREILL
jgi:hypothetical protein